MGRRYRAAQRRERGEAAAAGPDSAVAIQHALAFVAVGGRVGTCVAADPTDVRDEQRARVAWARLRAVLLARGASR